MTSSYIYQTSRIEIVYYYIVAMSVFLVLYGVCLLRKYLVVAKM